MEITALNTIDLVILVILVASFLAGILRGFVMELLSLVTWVLAAYFSLHFYESLRVIFASKVLAGTDTTTLTSWLPMLQSLLVQQVLCGTLIFVVTVIIGSIISALVKKFTQAVGLAAADRALGALFGICRGTIITSILLLVGQQINVAQFYIQNSSLSKYFINLSEQVMSELAPEVAESNKEL